MTTTFAHVFAAFPLLAAVCAIGACGPSRAASGDATSSDGALNAPLATGSSADAAGVPAIDELGYVQQLKASRPDLMADPNACYAALVLKPAYRATLLAGTDTYQSIVASLYTAEQKASDLSWMQAQQDEELALCREEPGGGCLNTCKPPRGAPRPACAACKDSVAQLDGGIGPGVAVSGYYLCGFVGYSTNGGGGGPIYDPNGVILDWKVFFEFSDDFATQLTPAAYLEFSQQLAAAGFRGDSKICTDPLSPEQTRFQYNNIIVHGRSPSDARLAEQVGVAMFGAVLIGRGRGVDVGTPPNASNALDWHHFLCTGSIEQLSQEGQAFVQFQDDPALFVSR
jgi:hypothetical protein